MVLSRFNH